MKDHDGDQRVVAMEAEKVRERDHQPARLRKPAVTDHCTHGAGESAAGLDGIDRRPRTVPDRRYVAAGRSDSLLVSSLCSMAARR